MTMIAYAFLNELILEKKMSDPALALQKLNAYLSYAFAQERNEINYQLGMELSIFSYSRTPPETHWQCAFAASEQNLLYTTPNGLEELQGDRATIGSNNMGKDLEFTRHEFSLPPGEMVYLTTDGFLDTPNPARKKISGFALKEALWQNRPLNTSQQKEALWQMLQQHRQQEDYRDDITVLGLRL
ncbi:MAG: SpoIIE family protein phosphatase [Microscillaceae bacterium]|nr:SpoIIE family protein phosphatase [Microscillaceae bacterium]